MVGEERGAPYHLGICVDPVPCLKVEQVDKTHGPDGF